MNDTHKTPADELQAATNPTPCKAWSELIRCPECSTDQWALVEHEHNAPFASYVHDCQHCGHVILASEWNNVGGSEKATAQPCAHIRTSGEGTSYCDLAETAVKTLEARLARAHNAMRVAEDQALTVAAELDEAIARAESAEARIAELEAQLGAEKERAWAFEQMASETSLDKIKKWFYEIHRTNENFSQAVISCQFRAAEAEAEAARLRAALTTIAEWPFDIRGDCVADARKLARAALAPGKEPE
jgi:DNA-directed RNA polymerase subunit RPC12/RpoP